MNKKLQGVFAAGALLAILAVTTVLYLYTSGYRLNKTQPDKPLQIKKTGMISAKSNPEGATVFLDEKLTTATNDTISSIEPGLHKLRIIKKGYVDWTKDIEVFPELVTDITAVLISQSPRLEPLTNTGAYYPTISPSLSKLAYFSKDTEEPGLWVIPLSQGALSIFRTSPYIALKDTPSLKYSASNSIEWSPDEKYLLIGIDSKIFYLIDLQNNSSKLVTKPEDVRTSWIKITTEKRQAFIDKLDIPENIKTLAVSPKSVWSPDEKKFLYTNQSGDSLEYKVYNMEKPIPVGEKPETLVFTTNAKDAQPRITWYQDSFHLILAEGNITQDKKGLISIIRIDGTNKTELFNNTLLSEKIYSAPGGDKIIILTTFKSNGQPNLYTIGIK